MAPWLPSGVIFPPQGSAIMRYKGMCAYDISLHAKFSSDYYNLRVIDAQKFTSTTENKIQHNLKNICTHKNEL